MNCLFTKNPAGGFESQHNKVCGRCRDADPVVHVHADYWCGDVCSTCKDAILKSHRGAEVTELK